MEETEAQQSGTVHHPLADYLIDPTEWYLMPQPSTKIKEVKMIHIPFSTFSTEEYDKSLARIKELEDSNEFNLREREHNWQRYKKAERRIGELKKEKESLMLLNGGMRNEPRPEDIKLIKELEINFKLSERGRNICWDLAMKGGKKIKELEEKNEWLGNYAMGKAVDGLNAGRREYELEDWQEEYGWTQHIFSPLDNNHLLGCKKWMP